MTAPGSRPPIQVFGRDDSQPTRAALRFFKERRLAVSYVNLRARSMAPGELRRFVERLGAAACADTEGKAWKAAGLGYMRMDDAELAERLLADQQLLRLPLCRDGREVTTGLAEAAWKAWAAAGTSAAGAGASAGGAGTSAAGAGGAGGTGMRGAGGGTAGNGTGAKR
jgi:arsenate reductase-like glutaredoxin family protein